MDHALCFTDVFSAATQTVYGLGLLSTFRQCVEYKPAIFSADLLIFAQYILKPWRQTIPLLRQDQKNQKYNINYVFNTSRVQAVF